MAALGAQLVVQRVISVSVLVALITWVWSIGSVGEGRELSFSLLLGALMGIVLQRSKFCFFCMTREFIDERNASGLLGLLAALAVGTLGYLAIFGAILPVPGTRLPPDAHIGPVSFILVVAALLFGAGMAISGSCISAHLYRLGEGSVASIFALFGCLLGFVLGFYTWNRLYLNVIQEAPIVWLPNLLGYGGTALLQLGVLAVLATVLIKLHRAKKNDVNEASTFRKIFVTRWPTYIGGLLIGFIATIAFFRVAPLGVTAELGSVARTVGSLLDLLPERLEGLDSFSGCATAVKESLLSNNGVFITGLVLASWASALFAGQFIVEKPKFLQILRNFSGGILMGWGSMTALGCTVGTLLSGIMAGALSGWIFAISCFIGLWLTWLIRKRVSQ